MSKKVFNKNVATKEPQIIKIKDSERLFCNFL